MADQINFFLDQTDDPLLPDGCPAFDGGQFSNLRANLLQNTQSKLLGNCDIDKLGKLRTRRGTILIADPAAVVKTPSGTADKIVQGLTFFEPPLPDDPYIVAAQNKKLWKWNEGTDAWEPIAEGGTKDGEAVLICREGEIDQSIAPTGFPMGTTELTVKGVPDVATTSGPLFAPGEKLYFVNNRRTAPYEYTIASWVNGAATKGTITLEEPGLVFDVKDNWKFIVTRPATVNGDVAAGLKTIAITMDNGGEVLDGEKFVIRSENVTHLIDSHLPSSGNTTSLTWTAGAGLIDPYETANDTDLVVFAQGNDSLYFCDGVGAIFSWNGSTLGKLGSHSILDDLQGTDFSKAVTAPPTGAHILIWFQNRLIASGVASEPDAIFFSDYFDATSWDRNYQMIRIGGGESDPITGLLAWTDYNLLVFKKNSIYAINLDPSQNPNPDDPTLLVSSFSVKQLHKKIGCPAPRTAIQVGGGSTTPGSDVFFVDGDKKVHSIRRVMAAEQQQEVGTAMSLPIHDVMDTINLEHIDKACATYHNEHYILGIPSTRGLGGGTYANAVVAYNLLTQSWCGVWGNWIPTCFAMRTDLGSYSKMIIGHANTFVGGRPGNGYVLQWMDDLSLEDETDTSYEDYVIPSVADSGYPIPTQILTRAFTGGDFYSFKTGLSVEFEFDESVAEDVTVDVILDKVKQVWPPYRGPLSIPFDSLSEPRLRLPFVLTTPPPVLPASPGLLRKAFDLQRYGTWRELQFLINTTQGKLAIRSIRLTYFMDTIRLQTIPPAGVSFSGSDIAGTPGP